MTMTLVEADRMTRPIWKSPLLEKDSELAECLEKIKSLVPEGGYKVKNKFELVQFEFLDEDMDEAFWALIRRYEELTGEKLEPLRYTTDTE